VIAGVVLGADEGLSQGLRDRFRSSGLYHLLAVSGQNVAIIAGAVLMLAWLLGIARWVGELGVLGSIGGYVLAVGLQPSVVRAGIAGALASLAWLAARPRDRWYFILVAAAGLLAWNPYNLLDPGFQLSFAAVSAIFVVVPVLERRLAGYPVPRRLATMIAVSTACGLVTAPILWLDFGRVPLFSVLGNALAEPAVPPLLGFGLVSALLDPVLPGVAASLAWVNGWIAAYLAACARFVGGLPYAQISSGRALLLLVDVGMLAWALVRLRPPRFRRATELCGAGLALALGWRLLA
jgi:competence protein ComEC